MFLADEKNIKKHNKKKEKMSVEKLISEISKINKKNNFQPEKFKSNETGIILLEQKNENDREWYKNNQGYDVL